MDRKQTLKYLSIQLLAKNEELTIQFMPLFYQENKTSFPELWIDIILLIYGRNKSITIESIAQVLNKQPDTIKRIYLKPLERDGIVSIFGSHIALTNKAIKIIDYLLINSSNILDKLEYLL